MAKLSLITILLAAVSGCFARPQADRDLAPKAEERVSDQSDRAIRVFRIFGRSQAFLADYEPSTGSLRAVHKVMITGGGKDFWPTLQEDARMAREPRYFAVSRTAIPVMGDDTAPDSFRADLFRGHPVHESVIGHNVQIRITGASYISPATQPPGTHIMIGTGREMHAVPLSAAGDLVSFSVTDGIRSAEGRWASANLKPLNSRPATRAMGCEQNFEGELLSGQPEGSTEFWGICEKRAQAGM
jgi:hypothetical protein